MPFFFCPYGRGRKRGMLEVILVEDEWNWATDGTDLLTGDFTGKKERLKRELGRLCGSIP